MLRKTIGFMIAFAILFSSVIPAFSAQADNLVSPQPAPSNHSYEVVNLSEYEPQSYDTATVTLTVKEYDALKGKLYRDRVLLIVITIFLVLAVIGLIVQTLFLLSRPKYLRNK